MHFAINVLVVVAVILLLLQAGVTFATRIQFGWNPDEPNQQVRLFASVVMIFAAVVMLAGIWSWPWLVTVGGILGAFGFLMYGASTKADRVDAVASTREMDARTGKPPRELSRPGGGLWVFEAFVASVAGIAYLFI